MAVAAGGGCIFLLAACAFTLWWCRHDDSCLVRTFFGGGVAQASRDRHRQFTDVDEPQGLDRLNSLIQAERGGRGGARLTADERRRTAAAKRAEKARRRAQQQTPQTTQTLDWLAQRNAAEQNVDVSMSTNYGGAVADGSATGGGYVPPQTSATRSEC